MIRYPRYRGRCETDKHGGNQIAQLAEPQRLFELAQNHPNPFDVSTTIAFELERSATARLVVYDMLGRQVAVLTEGEMPAGFHRVAFDGFSLSDGVYIYTLQAEGKLYSRQMVLLR